MITARTTLIILGSLLQTSSFAEVMTNSAGQANIDRMATALVFSASAEARRPNVKGIHPQYEENAPDRKYIRRSALIDLHRDNLLNGLSDVAISKESGLHKASELLRLEIFSGEVFFLKNTSTHMITPSAIGWRADLLDAQGNVVGDALLRIMDTDMIAGRIELYGSGMLKILPTESPGTHEVIDIVTPELAIPLNDIRDPNSPESIAEDEEWARRMDTPENKRRLEDMHRDFERRSDAATQETSEQKK